MYMHEIKELWASQTAEISDFPEALSLLGQPAVRRSTTLQDGRLDMRGSINSGCLAGVAVCRAPDAEGCSDLGFLWQVLLRPQHCVSMLRTTHCSSKLSHEKLSMRGVTSDMSLCVLQGCGLLWEYDMGVFTVVAEMPIIFTMAHMRTGFSVSLQSISIGLLHPRHVHLRHDWHDATFVKTGLQKSGLLNGCGCKPRTC